MGDIDSDSFNSDLVEDFRADLEACSFLSIDLEMTGISFPNKTENGADTVAFRYSKIRQVAKTFGIIQIGIALFDKEKQSAKVYNFYVFPRPVTEGAAVDSIPLVTLCSASTNFNRSHGMDFGRWINKGITYVNKDTKAKLGEIFLSDSDPSGQKAWDRFFSGFAPLDDSTRSVPEYVSQEQRILGEVAAMISSETESSYKIPFVHGGQKWLKSIVNTVHEKYPQLRLIEEVSGGGSSRVITKKSGEEIYNDFIGFQRIWSLLTACSKPVVFHNGFLDLVFCYQAFENELPESLSEFKVKLREIFSGGVFDTRLIAIESNLSMAGSAALETLTELFSPQVAVVNSGKYDTNDAKFHEAGYDALLTGKVFIGLEAKCSNVEQWKNLMCISRCLWVLTIDTLDSDRLLMDSGTNKARVIRILSDMNPKCSTRDLLNNFEDLKSIVPNLSVNVTWVNDTSGILIATFVQPTDKSVDSVSTALGAKMAEIVKQGGAIGESAKLYTTQEYVKMQLDELSPEVIATQKKFRF